MSVLNYLPNELLVGILSHLHHPDLARVCRVSSHLNTIAEPCLYQLVSLSSWGKPGPSPFHIIILTLLSRPLLANHVRYLNLSWHATPNIRSANDPSPQVLPGMSILTAAATSVGLHHPPHSDGVQILLLLHLLPDLEVLDLIPPSEPDQFFEFLNEQAILSTVPLPIALQSIPAIQYHWSDTGSDWDDAEIKLNPSTLLALFGLPSIRTIDVRFLCNVNIEIDWNDVTYHVGSSTVTDLRFGYGDVSAYSFEKILPIPRALTHFSYGAISPGGRRLFDSCRFRRALESAKDTLQSLVLCFSDEVDTDVDGEVANWTFGIGSFWDWLALRRIQCSLSTLLGEGRLVRTLRLVDVLPVGIREFEIEMDKFWSFEKTVE